jgi:cystathionine gamma-synthase
MLVAVERAFREREGLGAAAVWMVSSRRMAERLAAHLTPEATHITEHGGICGVAHRDDLDVRKKARAFLQHTGGFLSSRQAEDYAVTHGLVPSSAPEDTFAGDATAEVRRILTGLVETASPDDVLLAPSGMNAFWSAFQAVAAHQRRHGRDMWLQVGWLYLDTAAILTKFTGGQIVRVFDVNDRSMLEQAFREHGSRLAAVVTEVTTNPLMHTPDLPWLASMAREHGACMMVDPSIASPFNVDVAPHADVILNSLTKYAAADGDVIAGAVVLTPRCPEKQALRSAIAAELEPVHPRDLARLAHQIGGYNTLLPRLDAGARAVAGHLARRRGVRRLFWSLQDGSRDNYLALARAPDRIAPVISFEIDGAMAPFYDAVPIAKGPSFGMRTSLLCPFVYLAHYDLVSSADGLRMLARAGLSPELLRLSVGEELPEAIIEALEIGFAAAGLA